MAAAGSLALSFEGFTLDPAAHTLIDSGGENVALRRSEFELLLAFVNHPGRALSRDYLLKAVAGRQSEAFDRSIDVLVGRLRRKIEPEPRQPRLILTAPGIGYRFAAKPVPCPPAEAEDTSFIQTITGRVCRFTAPVVPIKKQAAATGIPRAPRLSIVVLPLANLSNDPDQDYFADAITDDLTTDLARIEGLFVIASNTAFTSTNRSTPSRRRSSTIPTCMTAASGKTSSTRSSAAASSIQARQPSIMALPRGSPSGRR